MNYSFGILKPDCLSRGLTSKALDLVFARGLKLVYSRQYTMKREEVEFLYSRCRDKVFYPNLLNFMTSGDVLMFIVKSEEGINAIKTLNRVTGHTDPDTAAEGTLRSLGEDVCRNIAHSTADEISFRREAMYFLSPSEIDIVGLSL